MKVAMEAAQNLEVVPLLLVREHQHVLVQKVVYRNKVGPRVSHQKLKKQARYPP